MYSLSFKPYMYSAVTGCIVAMLLILSNLLCKRLISCRYIHSFDTVIVAASRYLNESAHLADWIFILVAVGYHIFYACPRFLSMSERKSCNNSFSIFSRLFSYLYSCSVFCRLSITEPWHIQYFLLVFSIYQVPYHLLVCQSRLFGYLLLCFFYAVWPLMIGNNSRTFSYFLDITKPPMILP